MTVVDLKIPARSAYVGVVRLAVASVARSLGLDEERVDDLKIAVSEATTNAVMAHEHAWSREPIAIRLGDEDGRLVVEVADRGPSYTPKVREEDISADTLRFRMALSYALIESLVDEWDFLPRADRGMRARLAMTLGPPR